MTEQDLKNEGAVEFGYEILEGIEEIIEISPVTDNKALHQISFMIESFLEKDYNVTIEKTVVRKLNS